MDKKVELKKLSKFRVEVIFNRIVEVLGLSKQNKKVDKNNECGNIK